MAITLIQLSDMHFATRTDNMVHKARAVARAAIARQPDPAACFLVLSGDIANTGSPTEYAIAESFFSEIQSVYADAHLDAPHIVAVPGNHDLNLRTETDTRQFLLDSPDAYLAKPIDFNGTNFENIISVQDAFFDFEARVSRKPLLANAQKLYYPRTFTIANRSYIFHCFNTAWLSRRREAQGKLYVPPQVMENRTDPDVALSVAVFHHPYNWLNAENQRLLKQFVENETDIVLTGHEHDPAADRHLTIKGQGLDYLSAPAFDDPKTPHNGFQLLVVDFQRARQQVCQFQWDGVRFTEVQTADWSLHRNSRRAINPFQLRPAFRSALQDMGTGFRHPRCTPPQCTLRLRDLFVYPDITRQRLEKVGSATGPVETFSASQLTELLKSHSDVLILGPDDCGKTSLARILYEDLMSEGILPVLVIGEDLRGSNPEALLDKAVSRAIVEQYATTTPEPYLQEDDVRKAIVIDGMEKAKLSRSAQRQLVSYLRLRFHKVIIFASDLFQYEDIATAHENSAFHDFERCRVKEFGKFHRHKLIRAWLSLGREASEEVHAVEKQVAQVDKTLATLLGKNVLPHFPVTILTLLQMLEGKDTTNTANGAYGYMYEVLLKSALAKVNPSDVDEKITYISGIGYTMFRSKQPVLTEEEMRDVHAEYCNRYDMVRDFSKMMADLTAADVLVETNNYYRFKYPYEYYYSVAKYFHSHASALQTELKTAADYIYGEANANVLIFYVYLTKDECLIRHIIKNAQMIYGNHAPCDMQEDVAFLNKLAKEIPPPLVLEIKEASANRDEHNRRQDAAEEQLTPASPQGETEIKYDDKLQEFIKITIAFKTLQVLGQVLRNFTGSLEGPLKLEITRECYALGMRTLAAILNLASGDIEGMRQYLGSLIAERSGVTDTKELASKADEAIVWLGTAFGFGAVKRVSYAVGHSDLTNTYQKLLERNGDLATAIIDATIKLDHFERLPVKELEKLEPKIRDNHYAYTVMRDIVVDHVYLYNVDAPTLQRLGAKWKISVNRPKLLDNRSKK